MRAGPASRTVQPRLWVEPPRGASTLANPAVHTAVVGTRSPNHVDDPGRRCGPRADGEVLCRFDDIMRRAVSVSGPSHESV
jgi:hypothetical protein